MSTTKGPLFKNLDADDPDPETTSIESVCVNCFKNGQTRLLLTKIPFYKEVVLMSFQCEHCGYQNNEIQSAGEIQPKGLRITLTVTQPSDLNRKVVKSDYSSVKIPEVNLEIPAQSQKGEVTTIEGIIERTITGLEQDQELRREQHPETAKRIDEFILLLKQLKEVSAPFTVVLEDISGNCYIENPNAPAADPHCKIQHFQRTEKQDHLLGIYSKKDLIEEGVIKEVVEEKEVEDEENEKEGKEMNGNSKLLKLMPEGAWALEELHGEVLQFQTLCPSCRSPCETNMKLTNIPHFKDVVIMCTICETCGIKTNEVKSGGGIEEKGVRFEVKINSKEDLTRDVLKSETCNLKIPELDCEVGCAALGGRFTTVEGILTAMRDQLEESGAMFYDSRDEETKKRLEIFMNEIQKIIILEREATLILDDPAGNSYVQSLSDDDTLDDKLVITRYERTFEQNEELGLNDMKTENY